MDKFEFTKNADGTLTVEEAVFQALGAASTCWDPAPNGVFDAPRAREIGDELLGVLLRAVASYTPEHPFLGLATTRELLVEIATRMEATQNSTKGREIARLAREAITHLNPGILDYRTVDSG